MKGARVVFAAAMAIASGAVEAACAKLKTGWRFTRDRARGLRHVAWRIHRHMLVLIGVCTTFAR